MLSLPDELLEAVLDETGARRDLVALALSCRRVHATADAIGALKYSRIVALFGHDNLWTHLISSPHLASQVRELEIYCDDASSVLESMAFSADELSLSPVASAVEPEKIAQALRLMKRLYSLTVHLSKNMDENQTPLNSGLLSVSCNNARAGLDTLRVRAYPVVDIASLEQPPIIPDSLSWNLTALRVLDLRGTGYVPASFWKRICGVMRLSTRLEEVYLPQLRLGGVADSDWSFLPHLRVLHVPDMRTSVAHEVLNFASAHPQLEEFSWQSPVPYDFLTTNNMPRFPRLLRLVETSHVFIRALLTLPRTPGSLTLETLEGFELSAETIPLLLALRGERLVSLTLSSLDEKRTLLDAARLLPNLRKLRILHQVKGEPVSVWEAARAFPRLRAFANATAIYTVEGTP
ncbi:unnamed protein product [Peniophora sp. CBMAI 1063]|nr:unnamed protein product [Peniophora sp. CBMAI 1063]